MDALFNSLIEPQALLRENTEQDLFSIDNVPGIGAVKHIDPTMPENMTVDKLFEMTIPIMERLQDIENQIMCYQPPRKASAVSQHQRSSGFANVRVLRSLDEVCMPVFCVSINTDPSDLNWMAKEASRMYPKLARKEIFSILRKWFRKHRDENGQKVFAACLEVLMPLMEQGLPVNHVREDIQMQGPLVKAIRSKSNLEICDETEANRFVVNKIEAFLNRRIDKNANNIKQQ